MQNLIKKILEEFDKKFNALYLIAGEPVINDIIKDIKQFIKQAQINVVEEALNETRLFEKSKNDKGNFSNFYESGKETGKIMGWNKAKKYSDTKISQLLKELK